MIEKKLQSVLWMTLLLSGAACGSQSAPLDTVADARAAALTNKTDDDQDGKVDENDEGLDEDQDGHVDEGGEHRDACRHRHESSESDDDADAGVDEEHETDTDTDESDEAYDHHSGGGDHHSQGDESEAEDRIAHDIAAIDCSDVPTTAADSGASSDDTRAAAPADAGM